MTIKRIGIVFGILLSVVGLVYTFHGVDLGRVLTEVQHLHGGPFWLSQGFFLLMIVLRALRWRYLLLKLKRFSFMSTLAATVIGMLANNILPARMGEVPRAVFLGRREQVSSASILANVVIERIIDLLTLLPLLCVYLLFSGSGSDNRVLLEKTGWTVLGGGAGLVAGLVLLNRFEPQVTEMVPAIVGPMSARFSQRLERGMKSFVSGLNVFQGWAQFLIVIGLSLIIWLLGVASFFYLLESFSVHLSFLQVILVFVVVLFGIALPSAPGFIGTFHALCVAALSLVGVTDAALAAAYAIVLHGAQWMLVNLLGLYFLLREMQLKADH